MSGAVQSRMQLSLVVKCAKWVLSKWLSGCQVGVERAEQVSSRCQVCQGGVEHAKQVLVLSGCQGAIRYVKWPLSRCPSCTGFIIIMNSNLLTLKL